MQAENQVGNAALEFSCTEVLPVSGDISLLWKDVSQVPGYCASWGMYCLLCWVGKLQTIQEKESTRNLSTQIVAVAKIDRFSGRIVWGGWGDESNFLLKSNFEEIFPAALGTSLYVLASSLQSFECSVLLLSLFPRKQRLLLSSVLSTSSELSLVHFRVR